MASINDIISERLDRLESIPDRFYLGVSNIQDEIFAELVTILGQLNVGENFVLNEANLLRIDSIMQQYYEALRGGKYGSYVSWYISELDKQKALIDDFAGREYQAAAGATATGVFQSSRNIAVRQLLGDDFKTNFINVVRDNIISSLEGQSTFEEMVQNMTGLFVNDERLPQMMNWSKQVASDRFAITDSAYGTAIAVELDLPFFEYAGGLIKDSREFCVERNGKYFHINEAKEWAKLQWQGRFRNTNAENIFQWRGGYFCQHSLIFRSLKSIPREVIERNIANGNFTPSRTEKALLNL